MNSLLRPLVLLSLLLAGSGCRGTSGSGEPPVVLRYVGSSTVGRFVADANAVYQRARFELDTAPESQGGEDALIAGSADLGGVARAPRAAVLEAGVSAILVGRDAIAVVVQPDLPVTGLTRTELARVFSGEVRRWSELGGPDIEVRPFIMSEESATHRVFRDLVLGELDYESCETVRPDAELVKKVAETPGGIGTISLSFLVDHPRARAIAVDGEAPLVSNFDYPLTRPLFLLWRPGRPAVDDFVAWAVSEPGQRVVQQHFVGTGVVASVGARPEQPLGGTLIVRTPTDEVYDGGIYYHPHRPYELFTREGKHIRTVRNHVGRNDERPMSVVLAPGVYLVRARDAQGRTIEAFATVQPGRTTEIDAAQLLAEHR